VKTHPDGTEAGSASPSTEESVTPPVLVVRVLLDQRQALSDRLDTLNREVGDDGVGFRRPESFDGVGDSVETGGNLKEGSAEKRKKGRKDSGRTVIWAGRVRVRSMS
jgi:hypothetical protein